MEREILFRGKRLDGGEWVEGNYYESSISGCFILQNVQKKTVNARTGVFSMRDVPIPYEVDPATVGQYVGMPDKNGTKIFDGDLLKYTGYEDDTPYRVFWKHTGWYIQYENRQPESLGISLPEDWEIIGNIYDNPELLEATK